MSHKNAAKSKITKLASLGFDPVDSNIEACEQRLALSASLAGELLLDAFDIQPQSSQTASADDIVEGDGADASPNLIQQAGELRDAHGLDGSGQTVAVIDSGIAYDHVALGGGFGPGYRVVGGWDFAESDNDPYDDGPVGFHGSHVAGLLAGDTDEFQGIVPGADLVALRVFDDYGTSELAWIESALEWVHDNQDSFESPITTVNLSIGAALTAENHAEATAMLSDELEMLRDDGILVFAAAGNFYGTEQASGGNEVLFPASDPSVIAVSSVDNDGSLSDFAQRESEILATRGENIRSSVPDHVFGWDGKVDDFATLDGTSMATPQVAGASMLIRQSLIEQGIEPTADAILSRLESSAQSQVDPATGNTYHTIDLATEINASRNEIDTPGQDTDRFDGSNESEQVTLDLRDGIKLKIGTEVYTLKQNPDGDPLVIDVGAGADSLQIIGSDAAERLVASPVSNDAANGISRLTTNDFEIQLRGFESIAFDGGGGPDRATLYDSPENDKLSSSAEQTILEGTGFAFDVINVPRVYVHATTGGNDTAFLYDSAGDDALSVRPQFTSLRSDASFQSAYGFERVYAYANSGGTDTAKIYDSAGDDTMSVSAQRSMISGPDYQVSARGFASVIGYATAGGDDIAKIYADETSSQWDSTDDRMQWTGQDESVRIARGFERNLAFENYEPISLHSLSANGPFDDAFSVDDDERKERAILESDAARSIFEQLGRD